jgi:hypothetical protein
MAGMTTAVTEQRQGEIWAALGAIQHPVSDDPILIATEGYIFTAIKELLDLSEQVSALHAEVLAGQVDAKNSLRLCQTEYKARLRVALTRADVSRAEGCTRDEKLARAEEALNRDYAATQVAADPACQPLTYQDEMVMLEHQVDLLTALRVAVEEKAAWLKRADSAVRLQEKTVTSSRSSRRARPAAPDESGPDPDLVRDYKAEHGHVLS